MLKKMLSVLGLLFVGTMVVNTFIALHYRWPAMFDAPGNPATIGTDFILHGTMISPPVHALVIVSLAAIFALYDGWRGVVAIILLIAFSALGVIAAAGEPAALPPNDVPTIVWSIISAIGRYAPLLIILLGVAELIRRGIARMPNLRAQRPV